MSRSPLERIVHRLHAAASLVSVLLLAAMVGIVSLNVVMRYSFQVSLTWSSELARYCMVWSAMLSAAILVEREEHLTVDVLDRRLSPELRRGLRLLVAVLSLTFFAALFVSGTLLVVGTIAQVAASMAALPMSVVYAILPISALLMFAGSAVVLKRAIGAEEPEP